MNSKIDICNMALTRIAAKRLTNFNDGTLEANDCNAIYEMVAKQVMAAGPWPSVVRRQVLAQLDETPAFEYSYAFQLPTNPLCLCVLNINECKRGEIDHKIEGQKLLINESTVSIRYLAYLTESADYDIYLEEAIIDRLCAELIYKRTGSLASYQAGIKFAEEHRVELLSRAGMQGSADDINSDTLIDARVGSWPNPARMRD